LASKTIDELTAATEVAASDLIPLFQTSATNKATPPQLLRGITGWINALEYGAVGDGETVNTTALQNALNALKTAGGGTLFIPEGTYLTAGLALSDADNITILGDGPNRTILKMVPAATSAPILLFTRCNFLTICDLEVDGNKENQTGKYIRGIYWLADNAASGGVLCEHGTFERLFIHDTTDQGLLVAGGRWAKLDKIHTERCGSTGNIGAGIHIVNASPDISLLSCDVQISNCSDIGSGLIDGDEGAGLQMQVGTHNIQVSNYTSWNATKYGIKCQAHQVELNNIQVFEPGICGIALQYNDVRLSNVRVEKTTPGSAGAIGIGAPQQELDPRNICMDLSNIHIVDTAGGFYTGLEISNSDSEINPVSHVHVANLNISGHAGLNYGLRFAGNVTDCDIVNAHVTDCDTNVAMGNYTINGVACGPQRIQLTGVHSKELTPGPSGSVGWGLGYGSGLLIGCTSEMLAGSSRVLWQNLSRTWGFASAQRKAWCGTPEGGQPISKINAGAITVSNSAYVEVNAESGTADDLTDITDGVAGQIVLFKAYTTRTITIVHNASKIILPGGSNYTLAGDKRLLLCCIAPGKWTAFNL
jgi:hypothetical protein